MSNIIFGQHINHYSQFFDGLRCTSDSKYDRGHKQGNGLSLYIEYIEP